MSAGFYLLNGKMIEAQESTIHPDNRSFRYGEGLFETMRWCKGQLPLWNEHWSRLTASLPQLYFACPVHFTQACLLQEIQRLLKKNKLAGQARIRLTLFKGEGGIWEPPSTSFNYLLQCWPLAQEPPQLNVNGLELGIFDAGWKSCDAFSNIKSNNYQLYALAAQYAKSRHWNECLVRNQFQRVCDTTIANLFFIRDQIIHTPALTEGCVAGVMRSHLLQQWKKDGRSVVEGAYEVQDLLEADELFLTNAIHGIRWVKSFGEKQYGYRETAQLYEAYIRPLFG